MLLPSAGPALAGEPVRAAVVGSGDPALGAAVRGADPGPLLPPAGRPSVEVVARGLDSPRGLAFGMRGELYVAEAGRGGSGPCRSTAEGGAVCSGGSGAITVVELGRQWRVVSNLPSVATPAGTGAVGPSDVAVGPAGEMVHVSAAGGGPVAVLAGDRDRVVVDPAGRALLRVGPRGRAQVIATFPRGVPSSVAAGPDGAWYVGETAEAGAAETPTVGTTPAVGTTRTVGTTPAVGAKADGPGAARIWRVEPGRPPQVYASGFPAVVDLAWSSDGRLHVLQPDALVDAGTDGRRRAVVRAGLIAAGGLAVRAGHAYVSNCGTCKGTGTVLRVRL